MSRSRFSLWPRTLFMRLSLILFIGLLLAHVLSFILIIKERRDAAVNMMLGYLEKDVASSVALLDRLPADERPDWLPRLERRTYSFMLGPGSPGHEPDSRLSSMIAESFYDAIGNRYPVTAHQLPGKELRIQAQLKLSDGSPLTIEMHPAGLPISMWLPAILGLQLFLLALFTWIGVRFITRPLAQLANAADMLGPDLAASHLPENGPAEVARAARAFNAMQTRIKQYLAERMQILAAISHDLQTPITRMRMRADMIEDEVQRNKFNQDLKEMQNLVKEGVTYARTMHGIAEPACRIDPDALLDSLVGDYMDAGEDVSLNGTVGTTLITRPNALRRVLGNLIDNAIKYAGAVEVRVARDNDGCVSISILDQGPGIPENELEAVFEPFYRVESSRNRDTGGTGLGLAIARQLVLSINAHLSLRNRPQRGLEARLTLADIPNQ